MTINTRGRLFGKNVLEGVNKEQAQAAKTKLEEAGAKADVK